MFDCRSFEDDYDLITAIVDEIDSLDDASVPADREVHYRQGLAALLRCRSLLLGMATLDREGRSDIIGVLLRALLETWYYGLIMLLGDEEDRTRIAADDLHYKTQLAKAVNYQGTVDDDGSKRRFPIKDRAMRVDKLLDAAEDNHPNFAVQLYDSVFRGESYTDAHAGIQAMARYISVDHDRGEVSLMADPQTDEGFRRAKLLQAAMLVSGLAKYVWNECGVSPARFFDLEEPINEFVRASVAE